jgi:hypothetical protein
MDTKLVFVKTEKGQQEISTRQYHLRHSLRYVLILVDGKSTVEKIIEKGAGLCDINEALATLSQDGFIQPLEETTFGSTSTSSSEGVKAQVIDMANSLLGAHSANVVKKIQQAPDTPEGLIEAAESCKKLIKLVIDESKAEEFVRQAREIILSNLARDSQGFSGNLQQTG